MRMRERCDPYIFYLRVRKYVTGSENCDALPEGLYYGNETTPRQYCLPPSLSFLQNENYAKILPFNRFFAPIDMLEGLPRSPQPSKHSTLPLG